MARTELLTRAPDGWSSARITNELLGELSDVADVSYPGRPTSGSPFVPLIVETGDVPAVIDRLATFGFTVIDQAEHD